MITGVSDKKNFLIKSLIIKKINKKHFSDYFSNKIESTFSKLSMAQ